MMSYFVFLWKKTYKNKNNLIPAVLSVILIVLMYLQIHMGAGGIYQAMSIPEMPPSPQKNIELLRQQQSVYLTMEDNLYSKVNEQIQIENDRIGKKLDAEDLPNDGWTAYQLYYMIPYYHLKKTAEQNLDAPETISEYQRIIDYYQYQIDHDLPFEESGDYRSGVSFFLFAVNRLLTMLVVIMTVYVSAETFSSMRTEGIAKISSIPVSSWKRGCIELIYSICTGMAAACLLLVFSWLMGLIGNSAGTLEKGVYDWWTMQYVPLRSILWKLAVLFICGIPFAAGTVRLMSVFFSESMSVMIAASSMLFGSMYLSSAYPAASLFIHLIPSSYLRIMEIVNGEMAVKLLNPHLHFKTGCAVLLFSSVILWTASVCLDGKVR